MFDLFNVSVTVGRYVALGDDWTAIAGQPCPKSNWPSVGGRLSWNVILDRNFDQKVATPMSRNMMILKFWPIINQVQPEMSGHKS